jgi:hypothetical protein
MRRLSAVLLAVLATSCVVIRGPRIDPHAEYDSSGRLAIGSRGALKVESESGGGKFQRWCDESWGVTEALALPEGRGFVVAARKHAHVEGLLLRERTTDLWLVRAPNAAPERLTENTDHEFDLALATDGRGVVYRCERVEEGGGLMRPRVAWGWAPLEPGAQAPALDAFGSALHFIFASKRYARESYGFDDGEPTSSWANPATVSVDRAALGSVGQAELIDARPQGDSVLLYLGDNHRVSNSLLWIDLAGRRKASLTVREPVAARRSPDGGRAVIVERDDWVFDWLVLVVLTRASSGCATLTRASSGGATLTRASGLCALAATRSTGRSRSRSG